MQGMLKYIKIIFVLITVLIIGCTVNAQQAQTTFSSIKTLAFVNGERLSHNAMNPNIVLLNLRDSTVLIDSNVELINRFLEGKNKFQIHYDTSSDKNSKIFFADDGYVFSFNYQARIILIGKRDQGIRHHSIWLEEFTF